MNSYNLCMWCKLLVNVIVLENKWTLVCFREMGVNFPSPFQVSLINFHYYTLYFGTLLLFYWFVILLVTDLLLHRELNGILLLFYTCKGLFIQRMFNCSKYKSWLCSFRFLVVIGFLFVWFCPKIYLSKKYSRT